MDVIANVIENMISALGEYGCRAIRFCVTAAECGVAHPRRGLR